MNIYCILSTFPCQNALLISHHFKLQGMPFFSTFHRRTRSLDRNPESDSDWPSHRQPPLVAERSSSLGTMTGRLDNGRHNDHDAIARHVKRLASSRDEHDMIRSEAAKLVSQVSAMITRSSSQGSEERLRGSSEILSEKSLDLSFGCIEEPLVSAEVHSALGTSDTAGNRQETGIKEDASSFPNAMTTPLNESSDKISQNKITDTPRGVRKSNFTR